MRKIVGIALAIVISPSVCNQGAAKAGEVKLLSALVMKPALIELAVEYERTSGQKLTISYDAAGAVKNRIQSGEATDVTIIQKRAVEALIKEGKITSGSNVILARSGVAAAVRQGAPKPDISSVEALKRALLATKSVAYPVPDAGHASGIRMFMGRRGHEVQKHERHILPITRVTCFFSLLFTSADWSRDEVEPPRLRTRPSPITAVLCIGPVFSENLGWTAPLW